MEVDNAPRLDINRGNDDLDNPVNILELLRMAFEANRGEVRFNQAPQITSLQAIDVLVKNWKRKFQESDFSANFSC
jgi:hypothetical protein